MSPPCWVGTSLWDSVMSILTVGEVVRGLCVVEETSSVGE